jgi:hypothetical protein
MRRRSVSAPYYATAASEVSSLPSHQIARREGRCQGQCEKSPDQQGPLRSVPSQEQHAHSKQIPQRMQEGDEWRSRSCMCSSNGSVCHLPNIPFRRSFPETDPIDSIRHIGTFPAARAVIQRRVSCRHAVARKAAFLRPPRHGATDGVSRPLTLFRLDLDGIFERRVDLVLGQYCLFLAARLDDLQRLGDSLEQFGLALVHRHADVKAA